MYHRTRWTAEKIKQRLELNLRLDQIMTIQFREKA